MRIASVEIPSQLALAPMAGVTDNAFRQICSELGAGLTYTELVSSKALCYQDKKSRELLQLFPGENPCCAQIFGSDPVCVWPRPPRSPPRSAAPHSSTYTQQLLNALVLVQRFAQLYTLR